MAAEASEDSNSNAVKEMRIKDKLIFISEGAVLLNMRPDIEILHKEIKGIKAEVNKLNTLLRGVFADREGKLSKSALKGLVEARNTPKEEYISHEEVKKWFGKLRGTRKRSES